MMRVSMMPRLVSMPRVLSISSVVVAMARLMRGGVMTGRIAMGRHIRMMRREAAPTSSICQTSMIRRTWVQRLSCQAHIAQPFLLVNHGLLPVICSTCSECFDLTSVSQRNRRPRIASLLEAYIIALIASPEDTPVELIVPHCRSS
jgi:hypothetical protein